MNRLYRYNRINILLFILIMYTLYPFFNGGLLRVSFQGVLLVLLLCVFFTDHKECSRVVYVVKWLTVFGLYFVICSAIEIISHKDLHNVSVGLLPWKIYLEYLDHPSIMTISEEIISGYEYQLRELIIRGILFFIMLSGLILLKGFVSRMELKNKTISFACSLMRPLVYWMLIAGMAFSYPITEMRWNGDMDFAEAEHGKPQVLMMSPGFDRYTGYLYISLMVVISLGLIAVIYGINTKDRNQFKEVKEKYYHAGRNVVVCTPRDAFHNMHIKLTWIIIYHYKTSFNGMLREDGEFRLDDALVFSYRNAMIREKNGVWKARPGDIIYFSFFSFHSLFLTGSERYEILKFLKCKKEEGYIVHINEMGLFPSRLGKELRSSGLIYTKTSHTTINLLGNTETYRTVLEERTELMGIKDIIEGIPEEYFRSDLKNEYEMMIESEDVVGHFYHLLAMAQYCVTLRGLSFWCKGKAIPLGNQRDVTFGGMKVLQEIDEVCEDPEVNYSWQILRALRKGENISMIKNNREFRKKKNLRVSYNEIVGTIVEIRNQYLGHGVMVYMVNAEITLHLMKCVKYVLTVFSGRLSEVDLSGKILIKPDMYDENEITIPAFYKTTGIFGKKLFLFSRKPRSGEECGPISVYVSFQSGEVICCDTSKGMKKIRCKIYGEV